MIPFLLQLESWLKREREHEGQQNLLKLTVLLIHIRWQGLP
ncbi:hypothetical protein CLV24_108144 [Pontibacter ummariensis]|uniref:Uncharacterized protein n=1 Tax=Pontibacter ummariensis TaxID=1610492 RepID=A0A239F915_9BACT|nr:hypothetical protein CLV24_108144 [Pontibacter ummariensis]SNS52574.1 hypothetical protein SAMN06296052_10841 [Pontibacter ummariensis]